MRWRYVPLVPIAVALVGISLMGLMALYYQLIALIPVGEHELFWEAVRLILSFFMMAATAAAVVECLDNTPKESSSDDS